MDTAPDITAARYVSLATRRRDGREVATPVWIAPGDGRHYVFSAGDAGKVKRIRNEPAVRLAVCDVRGRLLGGWVDGRARLVTGDPVRVAGAYRALRGKYGWQMRALDVVSRLAGRFHSRAIIEIELTTPSARAPGGAG